MVKQRYNTSYPRFVPGGSALRLRDFTLTAFHFKQTTSLATHLVSLRLPKNPSFWVHFTRGDGRFPPALSSLEERRF